MYFVITSYIQPPEVVKPHFKEHCAWLHEYINKGIFLVSGPKKSGLGGSFLVKSITRDELDNIIAEDSYHKAKVADYLVIDMDCKLAAEGLEILVGI